MKREEIEHMAQLARVAIPSNELDELARDSESILAYVSEIQDVAAEVPAPDVGDHYNVVRDDTEPHERERYTEALLEEAPSKQDTFIKVKRILP